MVSHELICFAWVNAAGGGGGAGAGAGGAGAGAGAGTSGNGGKGQYFLGQTTRGEARDLEDMTGVIWGQALSRSTFFPGATRGFSRARSKH